MKRANLFTAAIGTKPNPLTNITTSLVSYWPLSESSDGSAAVTRLDAYAFNQLTDVSPYAPSANGHASFTAANKEYLTIADNAIFSVGSNQAFTICAKIKPAGVSAGSYAIVGKGNNASGNNKDIEYMLFQFGNIVALRVGNGTTSKDVGSTATMSAGQSYEVYAGYDPVLQIIWIKLGTAAVVTAACTTGTQDTSGALQIGRWGLYDGLYFSGEIWDVGFWKRSLTSAEVTALAGLSYPWGMPGYSFDELQPDAVPNQDYWWDFSDTATLFQDTGKTTPADGDGEAIRVVTNKFTGTKEATAPSDAVRPVYKTGIQNSLGAALYNGTDSQLDHTAWADGDFTCFWVVKNVDALKGSHIAVANRYLAVTGASYDATPRAVCHVADNTSVAALLPDAAGFVIVEMVHSGSSWSMYASGNPGDVGSVIASVFNPSTIGPNYVSGATFDGWWLDGYVGEIVRYSAALSPTVRAGIRKALATKWGLTAVYYAPYVAV